MAGSVPATEDLPGYAQLVRAARAAGVRSAVDSRGPDLVRAIDAGPDLVKINAYEAEELLGASVQSVSIALDGARTIRERAGGDGHAVIVTLGEQGIVMVEPGGEAWHGTVDAHGNYPVGSGDAFLAGLLTALAEDSANDADATTPRPTTPARGRGLRRSAWARRRPTPRSRGRPAWTPLGRAGSRTRPRSAGSGTELNPSPSNPSRPTD